MKRKKTTQPRAEVRTLDPRLIELSMKRGKWESYYNLAVAKFIHDMPKGDMSTQKCMDESRAIATAAAHFANAALNQYEVSVKRFELPKEGGAA